MENLTKHDDHEVLKEESFLSKKFQRRSFLQYAGAGVAGIALVAAGCKKDNSKQMVKPSTSEGVYFGSGDIAILNYAYALEQLEAAFYVKVIASQYSGISSTELSYLTDIRDHEVAHREFFKAALGANAISALEVDFSSIDFGTRASVLGAAKAFEDLGVSAYNGAGKLIKNPDYLTLAGKIVSVEARHAALIRDLLSPGSFADNLDINALDMENLPPVVLAKAGVYIKTKINVSDLPTS
jgi:hypothetical protein